MIVTCIDDSAKPNSISNKCWVVKDNKYNVVGLKRHVLSNTQYFVLEEIQPDDPIYGGYNVNRFGFTQEELAKAIAEGFIIVVEMEEQ